MSDSEFPTPDSWTVAEDDDRPGEPLHPGTNTIVDRGNNPLQEGETIAVWAKRYHDGHGHAVCRVDLQVIGVDGDGDIFAILDEENPLTAARVYRLDGSLDTLTTGHVYAVPEYDSDGGELTVTREVKRRGSQPMTVIEARSLGGRQDWALGAWNEL